jgi:hypothetical protein
MYTLVTESHTRDQYLIPNSEISAKLRNQMEKYQYEMDGDPEHPSMDWKPDGERYTWEKSKDIARLAENEETARENLQCLEDIEEFLESDRIKEYILTESHQEKPMSISHTYCFLIYI